MRSTHASMRSSCPSCPLLAHSRPRSSRTYRRIRSPPRSSAPNTVWRAAVRWLEKWPQNKKINIVLCVPPSQVWRQGAPCCCCCCCCCGARGLLAQRGGLRLRQGAGGGLAQERRRPALLSASRSSFLRSTSLFSPLLSTLHRALPCHVRDRWPQRAGGTGRERAF